MLVTAARIRTRVPILNSLLCLASPVRVLGIAAAGTTDGRELHTTLLSALVALGNNRQLVRAPDAGDSGVERLALGGGRAGGSSAGSGAGLVGAVALPEARTLVLGRALRSAEPVEATVRSEDAGVPLKLVNAQVS